MSVIINPDSIKNLNPNNILKGGENIAGAQRRWVFRRYSFKFHK